MNGKILIPITLASFLAGAVFVLVLANKSKPDFNFDPIDQKIKGIKMLNTIEFAGELVPTKLSDAAERLERELLINTYQHSSTLLHLKLAKRYLPIVEKIFKEEGLPNDLKYIAVAESSLRNAVSSAGAKGIWQFRDAAATENGLIVNDYVDERNHFEKATRAAARYLKSLNIKFNSWALACAAYNMGPSGLASAMKEQNESDYYKLNLSDETNRYLFRIIAIKEIMENPEKFGYYLDSGDYYEKLTEYKELNVDSSIMNLSNFAHQYGISYRELKVYNPWLLKSSLVNKSKTMYQIRIPNK